MKQIIDLLDMTIEHHRTQLERWKYERARVLQKHHPSGKPKTGGARPKPITPGGRKQTGGARLGSHNSVTSPQMVRLLATAKEYPGEEWTIRELQEASCIPIASLPVLLTVAVREGILARVARGTYAYKP